jgi:hypothetical protein
MKQGEAKMWVGDFAILKNEVKKEKEMTKLQETKNKELEKDNSEKFMKKFLKFKKTFRRKSSSIL